jgi:hypothetical protein
VASHKIFKNLVQSQGISGVIAGLASSHAMVCVALFRSFRIMVQKQHWQKVWGRIWFALSYTRHMF